MPYELLQRTMMWRGGRLAILLPVSLKAIQNRNSAQRSRRAYGDTHFDMIQEINHTYLESIYFQGRPSENTKEVLPLRILLSFTLQYDQTVLFVVYMLHPTNEEILLVTKKEKKTFIRMFQKLEKGNLMIFLNMRTITFTIRRLERI